MEASEGSRPNPAPWATEPPSAAPASDSAPAPETDTFAERPELFVGAAFAGGLVLAGVLRLIGR